MISDRSTISIEASVRFWRKKSGGGVQQYIKISNLQLGTLIMKADAKITPSYKRVVVSRSRPFKLGYIPLDISRVMYLSKWCKNSTKKFILSRHFSLVLNSFKACIYKILTCSPLLWLCRYVNVVPANFSIWWLFGSLWQAIRRPQSKLLFYFFR